LDTKTAAFDFSKAAISRQVRGKSSAVRQLFSFAIVRQIVFLFLAYMLNANFVDFIKI